MIAPLLAATVILFSGSPQAPARLTGRALIERMMARYFDAPQLVGTISWTQTALNRSVRVRTRVQIQRPSLLFLHQQRDDRDAKTWFVVSDGRSFAYDRPEGTQFLPERLREPVLVGNRTVTVNDMYVAASASLGDKSAPLDIVMGSRDDLRVLLTQWPRFELKGKETLDGRPVFRIDGDWRLSSDREPTGTFSLHITEEGDLVRYTIRERFADKENRFQPFVVLSQWDVDVSVSAKPDPRLFVVR